MSLGARQGESLELEVEGPDEVQAAGFLKGLLRTIL
jgi:phosphocarrier protein